MSWLCKLFNNKDFKKYLDQYIYFIIIYLSNDWFCDVHAHYRFL